MRRNSGAADRSGTIYALATSDGKEVARMGAYQSLRAALVDAKIVAIRKRDDLQRGGDEVAKVKLLRGKGGHEIGYSVDGEAGTVLTVRATIGRQPAVRLNGARYRRNVAPAVAMAAYEAAGAALPYAKAAVPYAKEGAKAAGRAAMSVARTSGNAFDTLLDAGIDALRRRKNGGAWPSGLLSKGDAKKLASWWNANTQHRFFVRLDGRTRSSQRARYRVHQEKVDQIGTAKPNPSGDRLAVPAVGATLRLDGVDYVVERVLPFVHRSNTRYAVRLRRPGGRKKHEMVIYETGARSSIV